MKLFESNNYWKRRERMRRRVELGDTPQGRLEDAKRKLEGDLMWFIGAAILGALGVIGLLAGVVPVQPIPVVFTVILVLYVAINARPLRQAVCEYRECRAKTGKG